MPDCTATQASTSLHILGETRYGIDRVYSCGRWGCESVWTGGPRREWVPSRIGRSQSTTTEGSLPFMSRRSRPRTSPVGRYAPATPSRQRPHTNTGMAGPTDASTSLVSTPAPRRKLNAELPIEPQPVMHCILITSLFETPFRRLSLSLPSNIARRESKAPIEDA